ncbi:MAG: restriction endonuclease subunit S [Candidatus Omnitrophica bacterium]|nr:restriction endonuclease subunit S [Candidatus Omnitrophota bacterium]MBU4479343.1 restriction endonuclease subunit S [Candidatus Omnitrophota bacterium]MCG2704438.1 restriction endonuclease subunit S [Candidatus Omnitrophota bacterium]
MNVKPYPKYKSSGVDWLGDVPEKWRIKRLKCLISTNDNALPETTDPDYEMLYVDISSVDPARGIIKKEPFLFENAPSRARRIVKDGDTIVSTVRTYLRAIAAIDNPEEKLIVSTGFAVLRPRKILPRYLSYVMRSPYVVETIVSKSVGVSYPAINASEIGFIKISVPDSDEQNLISDFLDRETGRIDELIAKKERLIELLKEKRTALISRAVTKGLNPNVRLKPSGVKWLGDVPEHWEVKRLKTSANYWVSNVDKVPAEHEQPVRLCNYTDVYYNDFISSDMDMMETTATSEEIKKFHLEIEDVVITKDSEEWDDIAISSLVIKTSPDMVCGYHLAMIRPLKRNLLGQYLARQFQSSAINHQFQIAATGVTRYGLPKSAIGEAIIPIPPIAEQQAIAEYLDKETGKIDSLIDKVTQAIEILKEYRTAIISAAVTGKIDVKGYKYGPEKIKKYFRPPSYRTGGNRSI